MPKNNKSSFLTKPLTRRRFKKELKAATRKQFKPLQKELSSQKRASLAQSQRMSNYFQNYQQVIGRGRADVQAAYDRAGQTMGNYAQMAGSQNAALQGQLTSQAAQNASLYGGTGDTGAANLAVQGQASRVRQGADVAGAIAGQGANSYGYATNLRSNAKLSRIEALTAEKNKRDLISKDKMDLLREKGDFRQEYMTNAREGERRYELANKELRNSNSQAAKDRKLTRGQNAKDRKLTRGQNAKDRKQAGKDQQGDGNTRKNAASLMNRFYDPKKDTWRSLAAMLNGELDIPASQANKLAKAWLKRHGGGKKGGKGGGNPDVWHGGSHF